ncbi:MAG: class I SAM-dependent methyltransferase [Candidatus Paceibacterota bacterium]|jgi:SAM-dependent methyltransferase
MINLDIGCGTNKEKGYLGLDCFKHDNIDIVIDLNKDKIPFNDNVVDHIVSYHALEHIANLHFLLSEMYRISKPNAQWFISVPYYANSIDMTNPFHLHKFSEHFFRFYSSESDSTLPLSLWNRHPTPEWGLKHSANSNFEVELRTLDIEFDYYEDYWEVSNDVRNALRRKSWNICHTVNFYLQVIKGNSIEISTPIIPQKRKEWIGAFPKSIGYI